MSEGHTPFEAFADSETEEWCVEWDRDEQPTERTTTLAALAWYADNFDDEAEVTPL